MRHHSSVAHHALLSFGKGDSLLRTSEIFVFCVVLFSESTQDLVACVGDRTAFEVHLYRTSLSLLACFGRHGRQLDLPFCLFHLLNNLLLGLGQGKYSDWRGLQTQILWVQSAALVGLRASVLRHVVRSDLVFGLIGLLGR